MIDPASFDDVLSAPSQIHRLALMARLLDRLSLDEMAALHARLARELSEDNHDLLKLLVARWARLAPQDALRASSELLAERRVLGQGPFYVAVMELARQDAEAALRATEILAPRFREAMQGRILALFLPEAAKGPPGEAFARIADLNRRYAFDQAQLEQTLEQIFKRWGANDPAAVWAAALALPDNPRPQTEFRAMALRWAFQAQLDRDPAAAAKLMLSLSSDAERMALTEAYIMRQIGQGSTAEISALVQNLPPGYERLSATAALLNGYVILENNLPAAVALAGTLTPGDWQDLNRLQSFLRNLTRKDPQIALQMLQDNVREESARWSVDTILADWTRSKPAAAAEALASLPPKIYGVALGNAVYSWANRDLPAASQWTAALPQGEMRVLAARKIVEAWVGNGAEELAGWMRALPPDSAKWAAVETFAGRTINLSPVRALEWLRTVPESADRLGRLRRVWQGWGDRAAAEQWRNSPMLSASERQALR